MSRKQAINLAQRMIPLSPPVGKFATPTKLTPEGMMARANPPKGAVTPATRKKSSPTLRRRK